MRVHIVFRQNFSDNKYVAISEKKTLAETIHWYPKSYAKETPFIDLLLNSRFFIESDRPRPSIYHPCPAKSEGYHVDLVVLQVYSLKWCDWVISIFDFTVTLYQDSKRKKNI